MLKSGLRKYVKSEDKEGYNKSQYNKRLKNYTITTLEDLTLIAERTDESLQSEMFTPDNMRPFFSQLFKVDFKPDMTKEEIEKRRKRLLWLAYELLSYLGLTENAWKLAPKAMHILVQAPQSKIEAINNITAVYLEAQTIE